MSCFMCSDDHLRVVAIASLLPERACGVHDLARVLRELEGAAREHEDAIARQREIPLFASRRADLRVLAELHAMNAASVIARYGEHDGAEMGAGEPAPSLTSSDYARLRAILTRPIALAKLAASYEYQSCETPKWEGSDAERRVSAIARFAIVCQPEYKAAPWTI